MKFTAFILSFYFLMISAQPVLAGLSNMNSCCTMKCGMEQTVQHKTEKNKLPCDQKDDTKCPICNCNIYQCAFCTGTILEENTFGISLFSESANDFPDADLNLHSSYSSDCWQPPELV